MLSELNTYAGIGVKIRAMLRHMLTQDDYRALMSKKTVSDVALYLSKHEGYREALSGLDGEVHRGELEQAISRAFELELVRIFRFETRLKGFLGAFIMRHEVDFIKGALRGLDKDEPLLMNSEILGRYSKLNLSELGGATRLGQAIDLLKKTPYYEPLRPFVQSEKPDFFKLEMALDIFYFERVRELIKKLDKRDRRNIEETFGSEVDLLNIMWIIRGQRYFEGFSEFIYTMLIPHHYKLSPDQIKLLVEAGSVEECLRRLDGTYYRGVFSGAGQMRQDYNSYIHRLHLRNLRRKPYTISVIMSILHLKQLELQNLIMIIEGIRYQINMAEIERYVIKR